MILVKVFLRVSYANVELANFDFNETETDRELGSGPDTTIVFFDKGYGKNKETSIK